MAAWSPGKEGRDQAKVSIAEETSGASLGRLLYRDKEDGDQSGGGRRGGMDNRMASTKDIGDNRLSLEGFNRDPRVSVFNLANVAIGSGVLGFPYAFRHLGLLGGLVFTLVIYFILVLGLRVLIRAARHFRCSSFQDVVVVALGPLMSFLANIMILVYIIGALISDLIVTADIFLPFVVQSLPRGSHLANRKVFLCLVSAFVILPLALKRTMASLKWSGVLAVWMLSYLAITLFCFFVGKLVTAPSVSEEFRHVALINIDSEFFACLGLFVFALSCHIQSVSIFAELSEDASPLRLRRHVKEPSSGEGGESTDGGKTTAWGGGENGGRKVAVMDAVIFAGTGICLFLYVSVGIFGYLLFPHVESDILSSFPQGNLALNLVRFGMAVVTIVAYPVNVFPARLMCLDVALQMAHLRDHLRTSSSSSSSSSSSTNLPLTSPGSSSEAWLISGLNQVLLFVLLSVALVVFPLGIALSISQVGTVQSLVGCSCGVLIAFIVPGLFLLMGIDPRVAMTESTELLGDASVSVPLLAEEAESKVGCRKPGKLPTASWFTFALGWFMLVFGAVIFVSTVSVQLSKAFAPRT